jgi:hypothetical protein
MRCARSPPAPDTAATAVAGDRHDDSVSPGSQPSPETALSDQEEAQTRMPADLVWLEPDGRRGV